MPEIKRAERLSQALFHFVMTRWNLFTEPIRAKFRHFRTICAHTYDNSPTDPNSSSFMTWSCNFVLLLSCFVRECTISFHTFLCMTILAYFDILVEYNPNKHGQGTRPVDPNQRLSSALSTLGQYFVSFPASFKIVHKNRQE